MQRDGFTLVELVLAIGIFAVVVAMGGFFSSDITRTTTFIQQSLQNQQSLSQAFRIMTSEVRSMGPSSLGAYPIESASSTSFTFFSDINEDGLFDRVRYYITSSTFEKGVTKPTGNPLSYVTSTEVITTIIPNVFAASSSFSYYDTNFTGSQAPLPAPIDTSKIRVVRVLIYSDVNPGQSPEPGIFESWITIRNLRSN